MAPNDAISDAFQMLQPYRKPVVCVSHNCVLILRTTSTYKIYFTNELQGIVDDEDAQDGQVAIDIDAVADPNKTNKTNTDNSTNRPEVHGGGANEPTPLTRPPLATPTLPISSDSVASVSLASGVGANIVGDAPTKKRRMSMAERGKAKASETKNAKAREAKEWAAKRLREEREKREAEEKVIREKEAKAKAKRDREPKIKVATLVVTYISVAINFTIIPANMKPCHFTHPML